jgi:hypothetical protein
MMYARSLNSESRKSLGEVVIGVTVVMNIAVSGSAQDLGPLNLADQSATAYPLVRCAGLYHSVLEWAGVDQLGADTWQTTDEARQTLLVLASMVYLSEGVGADADAAAEIAGRDSLAVADIYLDRFHQNYAIDGNAWGNDEVFASDLEVCRALTEVASSTIQGIAE